MVLPLRMLWDAGNEAYESPLTASHWDRLADVQSANVEFTGGFWSFLCSLVPWGGRTRPPWHNYVGIQNAKRIHNEICDLSMVAAVQGWAIWAQAPAEHALAAEEQRAAHRFLHGGTPPAGMVFVGRVAPGTQGTARTAPTANGRMGVKTEVTDTVPAAAPVLNEYTARGVGNQDHKSHGLLGGGDARQEFQRETPGPETSDRAAQAMAPEKAPTRGAGLFAGGRAAQSAGRGSGVKVSWMMEYSPRKKSDVEEVPADVARADPVEKKRSITEPTKRGIERKRS